MRDEASIRSHRDDLRVVLDSPCDCVAMGRGHAADCAAGREMMMASVMVLTWALGEGDEYDGAVEQIAAVVAKHRGV